MFMRDYHAHEIGNVAVLGTVAGCGKTSMVETMAYRAVKQLVRLVISKVVIQLATIVLRRLRVSLLLIYQSFRLNGITVRLI